MSEDVDIDLTGTPVKNVSLTPVITAILKPTAEYLGKELRNAVKSSLENWKTKNRDKNIESHVEGVRKKLMARSLIRQIVQSLMTVKMPFLMSGLMSFKTLILMMLSLASSGKGYYHGK